MLTGRTREIGLPCLSTGVANRNLLPYFRKANLRRTLKLNNQLKLKKGNSDANSK